MCPENPGTSLLDPDLPSAPPPMENRAEAMDDADLTVVILQALTRMAQRSRRHQADLTAALRGADIVAEPVRLRAVLRRLCAEGAIEHLVPLSDGGLLLTVTRRRPEYPGWASEWLPLDRLDADAG